jgi:ubiquinone/menaquinone biosynthesis C-methylase UbiE
MALTDEYHRQFAWRDWQTALASCAVQAGQKVLDLGCGPGDISLLLQQKGALVTGIEGDPELIKAARRKSPESEFLQQDLRRLDLPEAAFDGLWCSFTAAYFVDLENALSGWRRFLKPGAWVCFTEMDDLLGHSPLPAAREEQIKNFYQRALENRAYDFRSGGKLAAALEANGYKTTCIDLRDQELSFQGPAAPPILWAWKERLGRMKGLQSFLGAEFNVFERDFLDCLGSKPHRSHCKVICCVGKPLL